MIPCFIPARSGSVGVPNKNMRLVKGKPLLQWGIEAAKKAKRVDVVYVTTDSPEYGRFAEKHGARWIRRPSALAEDVPTEDVILHALSIAEKTDQEDAIFNYDPIVTLQCTTPLVDPEDIDMAVMTYMAKEGVLNGVVSVTACREHPWWMFNITSNDELKPYTQMPTKGAWGIRQLLPPLYRPNGAIYVTKTSFLKENKMLLAQPLGYHFMPVNRSWDVDTEEDLKILELFAP